MYALLTAPLQSECGLLHSVESQTCSWKDDLIHQTALNLSTAWGGQGLHCMAAAGNTGVT